MSIEGKEKTRIIVSRCMECACIYGCNVPTEEGSIQKKVCLECTEIHRCVHRVVVMALEKLDKDQRDCETCFNKANCVRWPKKAKKNCFICESKEKCPHMYMVSLADSSSVVSHGYCCDECRVLGNPNLPNEEAIRKIMKNCLQEDVDELLSLLESLNRVSKIIFPDGGYTPISEVTDLKKMLLRAMIVKARNNPIINIVKM